MNSETWDLKTCDWNSILFLSFKEKEKVKCRSVAILKLPKGFV